MFTNRRQPPIECWILTLITDQIIDRWWSSAWRKRQAPCCDITTSRRLEAFSTRLKHDCLVNDFRRPCWRPENCGSVLIFASTSVTDSQEKEPLPWTAELPEVNVAPKRYPHRIYYPILALVSDMNSVYHKWRHRTYHPSITSLIAEPKSINSSTFRPIIPRIQIQTHAWFNVMW